MTDEPDDLARRAARIKQARDAVGERREFLDRCLVAVKSAKEVAKAAERDLDKAHAELLDVIDDKPTQGRFAFGTALAESTLKPALVGILAKNGIETLERLREVMDGGGIKWWKNLDGVGEGKAEEIAAWENAQPYGEP